MGNLPIERKSDFSIAQYQVFQISYETFVKRPSLAIVAANNTIEAFSILEKHALTMLKKSDATLADIAYKPWCIDELYFKTDKPGIIYSDLEK